jgi:dihydroorotate dehydrogenase
MNWLYRHLIRPVLFAQDPEEIHRFTLNLLHWASERELAIDAAESFFGASELPSTVFGLQFPNPVGLAAGMDKDGEAVPIWRSLGFGFSELGAVTWQAQPGNPPPRLFRAIPDGAIVNRMGFNNAGASALADALERWRKLGRWPAHPVGINLGKTKTAPLDKAAEAYANSLQVLWPHADFFVVNVSSPNTPGLRQLQDKAALDEILSALQEVQKKMVSSQWSVVSGPLSVVSGHSSVVNSQVSVASRPSESSSPPSAPTPHSAFRTPHLVRPILVKVAPDLSFSALDEILELVGPRQIAGIVATNTTLSRPETSDPDLARIYTEAGGLSGRPLRARSTEIIRHLYRQTRGRLPIIGVGGIFTAEDAWEKIAAGASLVQIYTSLVYEGPGVARDIVNGLISQLDQVGLRELSEAIGCENRL